MFWGRNILAVKDISEMATVNAKESVVTVLTTANGPVSLSRVLSANRETVWSFVEDDQLRELWWPGVQVEFTRGGSVSASRSPKHADELEGTVDVLVAGHAAGFVWAKPGEPFQTSVLISLHSFEQQTKLNIAELGFDAFENSLARASESPEAWTTLVDSLESVLKNR